jgi:hypothetical protein
MPEPVTFQRIYRGSAGLEHPASPASVQRVLRSMVESHGGNADFRVRLRMDDGSVTTVAPKGWRA